MLSSTTDPLVEAYDLAMLDLDGVVYVGPEAVPGAAENLARAREAGMRCAFVTNNASRPPQAVVDHLRELDVAAELEDVVTSAQAAASVLVREHGEGAHVLVLGGEGLWTAVREAGLEAHEVDSDLRLDQDEQPAALVTGYGPDVLWRQVMRAAVLVRGGLPWVASNTDMTIPTAYGVAPGHGVLVDTLRRFSEVEPTVAGKPERPLLDETVERVGGRRPLMVGDRIDTDIEGGINAGVDTLLVMTGVTGPAELVGAASGTRPTYVAADLSGLLEAQPEVERDGDGWTCGGWTGSVGDGRLTVEGDGSASDWWRTVAATGWAWLDEHGEPADASGLDAPRG